MQAGGDHRAQGQVRIQIRAAGPVLEPQRRPVSDDAQRARPVVVAPGDRGGGERALGEALVGIDVGRQQQGELAQAGELAGQERVELGRSRANTGGGSRSASEKWMWHELPSRSLNLAMKLIAMPSWAAISLAAFL